MTRIESLLAAMILCVASPAAASLAPPRPFEPGGLAGSDDRRARVTIDGTAYPVAWAATFELDGVDVAAPAFFDAVRRVTAVDLVDGWVVRLAGKSKE